MDADWMGYLDTRKADLIGILNGVDYKIWDPAIDRAIAHRYTADDVSGKAVCKAAIQAELGLECSEAPLVIFVNRVAHQKMADVVLEALPALLRGGAQFVLHGVRRQNNWDC
jgi:starch synthase